MNKGRVGAPRKHHFLPQFYQRRWAVEGHVVVYRRFQSGLSVLRKAPSAVGFYEDLYANLSEPDAARRQALESRVFQRIDNDAANALRYIESEGRPPSDSEMRSAWARFLLSMLHRAPRRIHAFRMEVNQRKDQLVREIAESRGDSIETVEHLLDDKSLADEIHQRLVHTLVNSHHVGSHLVGMKWSIVSFKKGHHPLVISDRPLIRSNGISSENGFLILPINCNSYFICANNDSTLNWFYELNAKSGSTAINDMICRQADELVISSDESQTRFIDNRLCRERVSRNGEGEVTWQIR